MANPFKKNDGWYWYTETFKEMGPYQSYAKAKEDLHEYCSWLQEDIRKAYQTWWGMEEGH